jgi:acyl-ACP thioesterase
MVYENTYLIDSRDADPARLCRPSALLGFLQEAAIQAASELHVSWTEMAEKYNAFWMMARLWYRLDRPLYWGERVRVRTWHRGNRGATMYRDFDLYRDGEPIGEAVTSWVLADLDSHKPQHLSRVEEIDGTSGGALCKDIRLHKLHLPEAMETRETRLVHYSDADVNGHVNNVRYADFACDALHLERLEEGKFVSSLQIGYLRECRPGETLTLSTGQTGELWCVHGADGAGVPRFNAGLTLAVL